VVGVTVIRNVVCSGPDQPAAPEAVHAVALVEDQLRVETPPETIVVGLAANVSVGSGG